MRLRDVPPALAATTGLRDNRGATAAGFARNKGHGRVVAVLTKNAAKSEEDPAGPPAKNGDDDG